VDVFRTTFKQNLWNCLWDTLSSFVAIYKPIFLSININENRNFLTDLSECFRFGMLRKPDKYPESRSHTNRQNVRIKSCYLLFKENLKGRHCSIASTSVRESIASITFKLLGRSAESRHSLNQTFRKTFSGHPRFQCNSWNWNLQILQI
jgi:hypothetical protein